MPDKSLVCVRIYFKEKEFIEVSEMAGVAGFRPVRLKPIKKRPHGWKDETITDTKGIAKFLHFLVSYYKDTQAERTLAAAQILAQEKELQQRKAKLGIKA